MPTIRRDRDRGASAVEYGLMLAALAALVVGVVFTLGGTVRDVFSQTCTAVAGSAQLDKGECGGTTGGGSGEPPAEDAPVDEVPVD